MKNTFALLILLLLLTGVFVLNGSITGLVVSNTTIQNETLNDTPVVFVPDILNETKQKNNTTMTNATTNKTMAIPDDTNFNRSKSSNGDSSNDNSSSGSNSTETEIGDVFILADPQTLSLNVLYPTSNISVVQNFFFNFTVNVTCNDGDCGEVNISLDPAGQPVSCKEILDLGQSTGSGIYTIYPHSNATSYDVYCDMTTEEGGWTLVASIYQNPLQDHAVSYHSNLTTLTPTLNSATSGIWDGMRDLSNTSHAHGNSTDDIRFSCKNDVDDEGFAVDLLFYNIHWYYELTNSTSDASVCFEETNGAGDTQPEPERKNLLTNDTLPLDDAWAAGYLEGEDSCGDTNDFTIDFDDRGMDSNQNDGTDWGDDDGSSKCGSSATATGAWFIWFKEEVNYTGAKGVIPSDTTNTPFYTNTTNPYNVSLLDGESALITWTVNATGDLDTSHDFFAFANQTSNMSVSAITPIINITIRDHIQINLTTPLTINGTYGQNYIEANATVTGNDVKLISIYLHNTTSLVNTSTSTTSPYYVNFSLLDDGIHFINATVVDIQGNTDRTETYKIVLDKTIPAITFVNPTPADRTVQAVDAVTIKATTTEAFEHTVVADWNETLELWLRFNNEINATHAIDGSNNSNNGTLEAGAVFGTGRFGKGVVLDGINDYVNVPHDVSLNITDELTIEAWIKSGSEGFIVAKDPLIGKNTSCVDLLDAGTATVDGAYNITVNDLVVEAYCRQENPDGFGGGWTLFANLDSTRCAESLPFGSNNVTNLTQIYATNRLANMTHDQWLIELYDGGTYKYSIRMNFSDVKELDHRFDNIVKGSEIVRWVVNSSDTIYNGTVDNYWFSSSSGITNTTFHTRTTFSSDDGSWGVRTGGTLNADVGGPQLQTAGNTPKFGQENPNTGDAACNRYWTDASSTTSANILTHVYIREGEVTSAKANVPYSLSTINGGEFLIIQNDTIYNISSGININDNEWHHIVATYNGSEMRLYIDGVLNASESNFSGLLPANDKPVYVGRHYNPLKTTNYFNGTIDEVRVYSRVLSPTEINASYNASTYVYQNTFTNLSLNATYTYVLYVQDSAGNLNQTEQRNVTFNPNAAPIIAIHSPANLSYIITNIDLNVTTDQIVDTWWYDLDVTGNTTFTPNITLTGLSVADHNITVYANNSAGKVGSAFFPFTIYNDSDGDGVSDNDDTLKGNKSDPNTDGVTDLNVSVSGNATGSFTGTQLVELYDSNILMVNFTHNFSNTSIDLSKFVIKKTSTSVLINFSSQILSQYNKTLFIADASFTGLCAKNEEINVITDITNDCTGSNETNFLSCLGNGTGVTNGTITCVDEGDTIRIENMRHSAIRGTIASGTSSTVAAGGGGGGGGSSTGRAAQSLGGKIIECVTHNDCPSDEACWNDLCVKLFDIKVIDVSAKKDEIEFFYFIKGMANINDDVKVTFWLENNERTITSGADTIYLAEFEEKTENTRIYIPKDITPGEYTFYVEVSYKEYSATAYRTIFIENREPLVIREPSPVDDEVHLTHLFIILFLVIVLYMWMNKKNIIRDSIKKCYTAFSKVKDSLTIKNEPVSLVAVSTSIRKTIQRKKAFFNKEENKRIIEEKEKAQKATSLEKIKKMSTSKKSKMSPSEKKTIDKNDEWRKLTKGLLKAVLSKKVKKKKRKKKKVKKKTKKKKTETKKKKQSKKKMLKKKIKKIKN